jgi:glyoxylase-like metal-dependent hydrolase (beta-lactamase superfamily II)
MTSTKIVVRILETGTVRVRPSLKTQPADRSVFLRRVRVLTDREWTEPLPINSYLVSHPEGYILFDTGVSPRCMHAGYFPWWMPTFRLVNDVRIGANEGIGARLQELGLGPRDLKAVVLSHLHHDHSGGLHDVIDAPVYVNREHWEAFQNPIKATIDGALPSQWPAGFSPKMLEPTGGPIGPWDRSYPITSDGKVVAVDTPGHSPGHVSLIVFGDDATYFLAGDATYSQDLLDREITDGINDSAYLAIESLRKIKEFARQLPLVVLPAHDTQAVRRMAERDVYKPTSL